LFFKRISRAHPVSPKASAQAGKSRPSEARTDLREQ
jgi:hypothetical protein